MPIQMAATRYTGLSDISKVAPLVAPHPSICLGPSRPCSRWVFGSLRSLQLFSPPIAQLPFAGQSSALGGGRVSLSSAAQHLRQLSLS